MAFAPRKSGPASQGRSSSSRLRPASKMNPKDPKRAHDGPKMVHSASGPQLQSRKPPARLPSLGHSASAQALPLPIKQPKARRSKPSSRLETLNQYVATSGCSTLSTTCCSPCCSSGPPPCFLPRAVRAAASTRRARAGGSQARAGQVLSAQRWSSCAATPSRARARRGLRTARARRPDRAQAETRASC